MRESRANARAAALPCATSRALLVREKAVELFAAQGFGQVSMRDLASHSGIQAGSIYHHFESKESLLFEIAETLRRQQGLCHRFYSGSAQRAGG
ncbi:TetR/AcrR family transcriptional regulator [Pseudomonas promysalinigenes]|nr:TetR/AcrR family transcriptional regulator [Pseudomonas promysalinigenes]